MARKFYTLDVFTQTRLQGNPLAVVTESQGLDDSQMADIAAEFNLSETVFILPPDNPQNTAKLRIFTPQKELPFAGHPLIGTAVLLAGLTDTELEPFKLELKAGLVSVNARYNDGKGEADFIAPGIPENYHPHPAPDLAARAVGLKSGEIGFGKHRPSFATLSGNEWLFIPVKDSDALKKARPDMTFWNEAHKGHNSNAIYLYSSECASENADWHTRMFAPTMGIAEDPATGSAAATFPGVIAEIESLSNGHYNWTIEQGYEMGRPSQIMVSIRIENNQITEIKLAGYAVIIMEGTLKL